MKRQIVVLVGLGLVACCAGISSAEVVVMVPGTSGPWQWDAALNASYPYGEVISPEGYSFAPTTPPVSVSAASGIPFIPGDVITFNYLSGLVTGSYNNPPLWDANGNPSSQPYWLYNYGHFPGYYVPPVGAAPVNYMELVGVFADANGTIVGDPVAVGDTGAFSIPVGATQFQLGFNDCNYPDNSGSVSIGVSEVPEPASFILLGAGAVTLLAYIWRRRKRYERCLFSVVCGLCLSHLAIVDQSRAGTILGPVYDPYSEANLYVVSPGNWSQAETAAIQLGGNLVTIHSQAENDWIVANVLQDFTGQGGPNLTATPIWIGLYDPTGIVADDAPAGPNSPHAANFTWVDGSSSTYRNWNQPSSEPNDAWNDEYYGEILPIAYFPLGTWNDADVNDVHVLIPPGMAYGPIDGLVSVPIPEPRTLTLLALALLGLGVFSVRRRRALK